MRTKSFRRAIASGLGAALLVGGLAVVPANAFSSSSSATVGGVTYKASATSCNVYFNSCDWSASGTLSKSKSYTHKGQVKANGINVSVTISASPSATISGNSTSLASATRSGTGRSTSMSGVASPSIFSVSVAARSTLSSGSASVTAPWTTW